MSAIKIKSQPQTPEEWKAYATSTDVTSIPLRDAKIVNEDARITSLRGVYFDASEALLSSLSRLTVFADVLAFSTEESNISPHRSGTIQITARVITARAPVKVVIPETAFGAISIYAAILDQPVTVTSGNDSVRLNLGPESEYVGVSISFHNGTLEYEYEKKYPESKSDELKASLNTQLRIALVQFWKNISIAISQCSYVAKMTTNQSYFNLLNTQAIALGQQLAGQAMAGPNMSYAPVLVLDRYKESTQAALNAATAFRIQFERFQDKKESLENQVKSWDAMLAQAKNESNMRVNLRNLALDKYNSVRETVKGCETQFEDNDFALKLLRVRFETGLQTWQDAQQLRAAFEILIAAASFAVNIATLCLGNPGGGAGAAASDTLQKLADCVQTMLDLYPVIQSMVDAVGQFETDPSVDIPSMDIISGSGKGDANAAAIVTVASWDKWILESDQQMEFAVGEDIDGAAEYRLALRKHAINGKQLAQAQAESVKAGYEYVQAQMEVIVSKQQIEGLQKLRDDYEDQEEIYALAEAMLYDRAMALRTSVVLSLRNLTWAYRYWALDESSVVLDSRKDLIEYQQDISTILQEMVNADSRHANDVQPFDYDINSMNLPANFGESMNDGIKGTSRVGSFTLEPEGDLTSNFHGGWHYRLEGLTPTLRGIVPKSSAIKDGVAAVDLQIMTSGIYADIYKKDVFRFASLPQVRRCSYDVDAQGVMVKMRVSPSFETKDHAEPTPFTQWKIKFLNPEDFVLDGLQGINLQFEGKAWFEPQLRKMMATA
ncbi:hypothetical protein E4U55_002409 [Claviceps digitariae]|nr:hypothetical protein E4U55_002409 [Claviceps digitariae]